ncbi:MAG: hypothetical protein AUG50_02625 [Betaproteobacteria bacterium 13_1_20CM_3_63_8]|nr:MAG: hypothetical protein AUG50_02625 [Betaproteobacteria bacterium 13_1_20CM_3_63_8]
MLHAAKIRLDGHGRTLLLTGIGVSAQEMWDAVKDRAKGKVRFRPDPQIQAIIDSVPKATFSKRAQALGFRPSASIAQIVAEYEEARLAHHG